MAKVVVTGANRGIGLELCRQAVERGDQVVALCRRSSTDLDKLGVRIEAGVDVSQDGCESVLQQRLGQEPIDVLINNAGILRSETLDHLDFDSMRAQFETNSLGPLRVTHALLGNLRSGSKVAVVTSRMGSIADNTSGSRYGYRMSKAAVNMAAVSLAHDLKPREIAVALLHPGFVQTEMTGNNGNMDARTAAKGLWERIGELTLATSGGFWHSTGEKLPW